MGNKNYHYYVEGSCEKLFVRALKNKYIYSGKVEIFNVISHEISDSRLRPMKKGTKVILVYDTDYEEIEQLGKNIKKLRKSKNVEEIICVPQFRNFEDELVRCTNIKRAQDFTKSRSTKDFKRDFLNIKEDNVLLKLEKANFDIKRLWSVTPEGVFSEFGNQASKIKVKRKSSR